MAVEWGALVDPNTFTIELAFLVIGLLVTVLYAGIRLKSPAVLFFFMICVVAFILTFLIQLQFVWFWIAMILSSMVITAASIVQNVFR